MLFVCLTLSLASEPDASLVSGFDRVLVDPAVLHVEPRVPTRPLRRGTLHIDNGHTARATVWIGDTAIGELLPKQTGTLEDVLAGTYSVKFALPQGVVRTEAIVAE